MDELVKSWMKFGNVSHQAFVFQAFNFAICVALDLENLLKVCFISHLQVKEITVFALFILNGCTIVLLQELQSSNGNLSSSFHTLTFFVYDWVALTSDLSNFGLEFIQLVE